MGQYTIGIDVGGTKTAYGLFDGDRKLMTSWRHPSDPHLEAADFFDTIADQIETVTKEFDIGEDQIRGIGIGMPSYVVWQDGYIIKTSNLPKVANFSARNYLFKRLGWSNTRIIIDNDAHTGALAEHRHGAGRGFADMLYCPISTGISSGIIINGEVFRGRYGWAGESGHMIVTPGEGIMCGCGNRGCLMSYCSGSMIVKHIQNRIADGEQTDMVELAGGAQNIDAEHIRQACETGDALALWAVAQMVKYMAVWTFNLYSVLNINCFVFGGGLLNFGDRLLKSTRTVFDGYNQNDLPVYFKSAELGSDFGIVGAADLLF